MALVRCHRLGNALTVHIELNYSTSAGRDRWLFKRLFPAVSPIVMDRTGSSLISDFFTDTPEIPAWWNCVENRRDNKLHLKILAGYFLSILVRCRRIIRPSTAKKMLRNQVDDFQSFTILSNPLFSQLSCASRPPLFLCDWRSSRWDPATLNSRVNTTRYSRVDIGGKDLYNTSCVVGWISWRLVEQKGKDSRVFKNLAGEEWREEWRDEWREEWKKGWKTIRIFGWRVVSYSPQWGTLRGLFWL